MTLKEVKAKLDCDTKEYNVTAQMRYERVITVKAKNKEEACKIVSEKFDKRILTFAKENAKEFTVIARKTEDVSTSEKMYKQLTCRALAPIVIEKYLKGQGNPCPMREEIAEWQHNGKNQWQYNECILNNYDLCDFDRWQYLQQILGTTFEFKTAMEIAGSLYVNEDIDVIDLPSRSGK